MLAKTDPQFSVYATICPNLRDLPRQYYGLLAASCSNCHGPHDTLIGKNPRSRFARDNIPATCGAGHSGAERAYFAGVHGRNLKAGNWAAPVCSDFLPPIGSAPAAHRFSQNHPDLRIISQWT
jgi:hypothetical protein